MPRKGSNVGDGLPVRFGAWLPGAAILIAALSPSVAFARKNLTDFITSATDVVLWATPFAVLILLFFWSMFQLIMTTGDAEKKKQAKQRIIWGIIAIFVIFTIGGIVAAINQTFFAGESTLQQGLPGR